MSLTAFRTPREPSFPEHALTEQQPPAARKRSWEVGAGLAMLLALMVGLGWMLYRQSLSRGLTEAVAKGDAAQVRELLSQGVDPNLREPSAGMPMVAVAADRGQEEVVRLLLDRGARVDTRATRGGDTALTQAAYRGNLPIVKLLLERGAAIDGRNDEGMTALIAAAWQSRPECVRFLLQRGADRNARTRMGTALALAQRGLRLQDRHQERVETVKLLRQAEEASERGSR